MAQEPEIPTPLEPETIEQTGLPESIIESLVLKILYFRSELYGQELSAAIGLKFSVIQEIVEALKVAHLIQVKRSMGMGNVGAVDTSDPDKPSPPFHYSVAKMGVNGLTKYFAGALGPWGINVNAIAPGVTMTEATKSVVPEEMLSMLVMFTALKKPLQPEDLTGTALFLASSDSDMMTGQVLVVDAGMMWW